jgi:inner membrane transporter RhtA
MQSTFPQPASYPILPSNPSTLTISLNRGVRQAQALGNSLPPSCLVVLSSFVIQLGMALSKSLFESLGAVGAAFLCKGLAALLLLIIWRPSLQHRWQDYLTVSLFGLSIACMNLAIYSAIERIPLGIASTLEFVGPLGVAIAGSRRPLDFLWVALAATGVILIAPITNTTLDPVGIGLALLSGLFWAGYILLSAPVGRAMPGGSGLALGITFASLFMAPFGIQHGGSALLNPWVLMVGLVAAFMTTVMPYSMEFAALKRMSPRVFGVLMSIEPAIAALVGLIFLHESLDGRSLVAIGLVITAAIGVTVFGKQGSAH